MVTGVYLANEQQQLASLTVTSGSTPYKVYICNNFQYVTDGTDGKFLADLYGDANSNNIIDFGDAFIGQLISISYLGVINDPNFSGGGPSGDFIYDDLTGIGYALSGTTRIGEARLVNGGDFWGRKISVKYDYASGEVPVLAPPPAAYGLETADIVTNFDPKRNQLKIDFSEFPGASLTFKACKKTIKLDKLATKDISFLYNRQTGYLHYDANGSEVGFGSGGVFAILEGAPKLNASAIDFV